MLWAGRVESDSAQREVFFEAVGLEEVGEFERADVATVFADFLLKIPYETSDVFEVIAATQELPPCALSIIAKAQVLSGQFAIELVGGMDLLSRDFLCGWIHWIAGAEFDVSVLGK